MLIKELNKIPESLIDGVSNLLMGFPELTQACHEYACSELTRMGVTPPEVIPTEEDQLDPVEHQLYWSNYCRHQVAVLGSVVARLA